MLDRYVAVAAQDDELAWVLTVEETAACVLLIRTPCANDAELLVKLRYLFARKTLLFGNPSDSCEEFASISQVVALHFQEEGK